MQTLANVLIPFSLLFLLPSFAALVSLPSGWLAPSFHSSMAKDDAAAENLHHFRKLFIDYTNNQKKPPSARRSSSTNSPNPESPLRSPQKRSGGRMPRSRKKDDPMKSKTERETSSASPSTATPEKDSDGGRMAEAKDLLKEDDEEFENAADSLAKCKIKTRDLQWKGGEDDKNKKVTEVVVASRSVDDVGDTGIRRRKIRSAKKPRSVARRKTTARNSSSSPSPSAEALDDNITEKDKGGRFKGKKSNGPELRSKSPSAESCNEDLPEIDQNSKEFQQGLKLMEILKRNNLLENALFPAQNEVVKVFFEGGMSNPDNKILGLISKAMDFVLDAVFFRGEDLDCMLDNDLKQFIVDRSKSKPILLDVIVTRPECLPQSWGGRTVVLRAAAGEAAAHPEAKKEDKK